MSPELVAGSFRDPAGFMFRRDGVLYRQVDVSFAEHYDHLMASGLYATLVGRGLLVEHAEVDAASIVAADGAHRVLRPQVVPFVSYPYEWCFSQLKAAALATLEIQEAALDHGMSLRDASAYNIQLVDGRAVLIDTLSFARYEEGAPWVAYRQFCQHFLAPLAVMSAVDVRLGQLLRVHLDGLPLDLASTLLPGRTRMRPGLALHIHQHARSQQRHAGGKPEATGKASGKAPGKPPKGMSEHALRGLVSNLAGVIGKLDWDPPESVWRDYYEGDSYTDEAFEHKRAAVADLLREASPGTVWDLGANTGEFSRLAAETGAVTVSFELDQSAVELNHRRVVSDGTTGLLPLVLDVTNPSPGLGWANRERDDLAGRGPADLAMALALVHHIAIGNNVPLDRIAAFLAELCAHLIIEFVPKSDPKTQLLLASREDVFDDYTVEGFEAAFGQRFVVKQRVPVRASDRVLYLMRRR